MPISFGSDQEVHFNQLYGADPNVSTVSPTVGKELARNAFIASLIAMGGIIIYVAFRFEWLMGLAAVVALFHDAAILSGIGHLWQL